ncbi:MAG: hypothetical protein ACKVIH_12405 [Burkholderiales bacterium]
MQIATNVPPSAAPKIAQTVNPQPATRGLLNANAPNTMVANEKKTPPQPKYTTVLAPFAPNADAAPPNTKVITAAIRPKMPATKPSTAAVLFM